MSLSSARKRGPIRRVLSMRHDLRKLEASVVMSPRFRGDDSEECCAIEIANASPPGGFVFGARSPSSCSPYESEGSGAPEGAPVSHLAIGATCHACEAWRIPCDRRQVYAVCANKLRGMLASRRSTGGVLVSAAGRAFVRTSRIVSELLAGGS